MPAATCCSVRCWPWIPGDWHRLNRPWTRCSVGWEPNGYTSRCRPLDAQAWLRLQAHVRCEQTAEHRAWRDIAPALAGFDHAETVFGSLAAAEAQVHGVPIDDIHFHEVGALDAIADIVAVTTLWQRLQPSVVVVSPVCVGSGTLRTAHGELSVPVPAVVQLLRGSPSFAGNSAHEACTPTGAALLQFMATAWGFQP